MKFKTHSCAASVAALLSFSAFQVAAQIVITPGESITSESPTDYCVLQTSVRGSLDNLVIEHNLLVDEEDHFETGDVFVAARFKSNPQELWLLKGIEWRRIETNDDLHLAQQSSFDELPLVIPISIFHKPTDVSAFADDGQIWVGYGLRTAAQSPDEAFQEMLLNERYSLLWEAVGDTENLQAGLKNPTLTLCLKTSEVELRSHTGEVGPGAVGEMSTLDP